METEYLCTARKGGYAIVSSWSTETLVKEVAKMQEKGWRTEGPMIPVFTGENIFFYQTMHRNTTDINGNPIEWPDEKE